MSKLLTLGAINKITGEYVFPKIANKKDKYICIECNRDLILRQGEIRVHHFSHKVDTIKCNHYTNPSETQIHKDAKNLLKNLLERKIPISFCRKCCSCKKDEEFEIPEISETSVIELEYQFEYNGKKIADVVYIDNNDIVCIFEIYKSHKTNNQNRPEPWFEIDAKKLIEIANDISLISLKIPCIRFEECEECSLKKLKYTDLNKYIRIKLRQSFDKTVYTDFLCDTIPIQSFCFDSVNTLKGTENNKNICDIFNNDYDLDEYRIIIHSNKGIINAFMTHEIVYNKFNYWTYSVAYNSNFHEYSGEYRNWETVDILEDLLIKAEELKFVRKIKYNYLSTLELKIKSSNCSVLFNSNGILLARESVNSVAELWFFLPHSSVGTCISTLVGHKRWISSISFNQNGTLLATGSGDNTVKLWNFSHEDLTSRCVATLKGHSSYIKSVEFHPTESILATTSNDRTVKLWNFSHDVSTTTCVATLEGHSHDVLSVKFHRTKPILATCSADRTAKLWIYSSDFFTTKCASTLKGHLNYVTSVAFHLTASILATGSYDCTVKLWSFLSDGTTATCMVTLEGHRDRVTIVEFHPKAPLLVTCSIDNTTKLWHFLQDGSMAYCVKSLSENLLVSYNPFNLNGTLLVSRSNKFDVKMWSFPQYNINRHTKYNYSPLKYNVSETRKQLMLTKKDITSFFQVRSHDDIDDELFSKISKKPLFRDKKI